MPKNREGKLREEISTLEDAILYADSKGVKNLEEAQLLLNKVKKFFEQGTWGMAEKEFSKAIGIKSSQWYREFIEKREEQRVKTGGEATAQTRFIGDGLCGKYGHLMVRIRLSNVRWYYQCRICGKRGKYRSIK